MNYYNQIKESLIKCEIYDRAKDYSKDRNKVNSYFEIGKLLSEAGKEYGKNIIKQYSQKLMVEVGKKYNERNLRYMRQFYEMIIETKWNAMRSKLCWSHYREVLSLNDIYEIRYYLNECENKSLTHRQLHEIIKQNLYNRLSEETKNKLIESKHLEVLNSNMISEGINQIERIDKLNKEAIKQLTILYENNNIKEIELIEKNVDSKTIYKGAGYELL